MSLESTIICLDNSEWMRNGDYIPTRMEAQHDAASLLCGTKIRSNQESTVGVLSMAGKGVELLVSPTENMGKILGCFHNVPLHGQCRVIDSTKVAQLALKHRPNKRGSQRIVLFIGSPVNEQEEELVQLGQALKKNNIAVDVVSLGEIPENDAKLRAFVEAANSNDNSNLVSVPQGSLPSDVLVSTPIFRVGGERNAAPAASAGGANDFAEFGVDPNVDPDLALALRVSLEEERARQEAIARQQAQGNAENAAQEGGETNESHAAMTEEEEIRRALELSLQENPEMIPSSKPEPVITPSTIPTTIEKKEQSTATGTIAPPPVPNTVFLDPTFVNSLISGMPGVDPNDPKIKEAIDQATLAKSEKEKKDKKNNEKDQK